VCIAAVEDDCLISYSITASARPSSESGTVRSERLGGLETGMATFNRTPNTIGVRNAIYNL
jgi:hypothetical protein